MWRSPRRRGANVDAKGRPARIAAVALALVVGAGCAIGTPSSQSRRSDPAGRTATPSTGDPNAIVRSAITDVERFWSGAFPALSGGAAFHPVSGGYHPYTRQQPPPQCGQSQWEYQPNAFYC